MKRLLLIILVFLTACFELEQEYFLNPDGSGKVSYSIIQSMDSVIRFGDQELTPENEVKKMAKNEINLSKGVSTWSDVQYKILGDGKLKFSGTAYFQNLNKLKLRMGGVSSGLYSSVKYVKDKDKITFSLPYKNQKKSTTKQSTAKQFEQYKLMRSVFVETLGKMKSNTTLNLPGEITKALNFKSFQDKTARFDFSGETLIKVLDQHAEDENFVKQLDQELSETEINELLLGKAEPVQVTVEGNLQPVFDYQKETSEAEAKYESMLENINLRARIPAKVTGNSLTSAKVSGMQITYDYGLTPPDDSKLKAFHTDPGVTLALLFEFPGSITAFENANIEQALTDNGENLLPESEWERKVSYGQLSENKDKLSFQAKLSLPKKPAKKLKLLTGSLVYLVSGEVKKVDLGLKSLVKDSTGNKFQAQVTQAIEHPWEKDKKQISIKLGIDKKEVESFEFRDSNGSKLDISDSGYVGGMGSYTYSFSVPNDLPLEDVKVFINIFDKVKTYEADFKIENIDLNIG